MHTRVGMARVDITPPKPVALSGFGSRHGSYEGIARRLYANVWLFEQKSDSATVPTYFILIQADFICWPSERMDRLRSEIRNHLHIEDRFNFFNASHTHGGPMTTLAYFHESEEPAQTYMSLVSGLLGKAIDQAKQDLEPVVMSRGSGACTFNIYRRKWVDGQMEMAPNPEVPVDHEVIVLHFRTEGGATKGVLFHFACHPTTTNANLVTSEYPGAAVEIVERQLGNGANAVFLQGCSGDIRPALQREGRFYSGTSEDVDKLGGELAAEVLRVLSSPMEEVPFEPIVAHALEIDLVFERVPDLEELRKGADSTGREGDWCRALLKYPERVRSSVPLHLGYVRLGRRLGLLTMDGEMVQEYGRFIKDTSQGNIVPLGYSNGMIGYIPTAVQVDEGGYEGKDSAPLFSLPSPFKRTLEERIKRGILEIMRLP